MTADQLIKDLERAAQKHGPASPMGSRAYQAAHVVKNLVSCNKQRTKEQNAKGTDLLLRWWKSEALWNPALQQEIDAFVKEIA